MRNVCLLGLLFGFSLISLPALASDPNMKQESMPGQETSSGMSMNDMDMDQEMAMCKDIDAAVKHGKKLTPEMKRHEKSCHEMQMEEEAAPEATKDR